ncbi:MAG: hypothetical protein QM808_04015 [Steroidobacteraceae bacterium]
MNKPGGIKLAVMSSAVALLISSACFSQANPPSPGAGGGGSPGAPGRSSEVDGAPKPAPAKLQNFVGVWSILRSAKRGPVPEQGDIPFTAAYEAKRAELMRQDKAGEVIQGRNRLCKPTGMPDMMTFGFIVSATAEYMTVFGGYGTFRPVYLNRKQHTKSNLLFPTYQGENLGSWDGDTLVIDSVGYDPTNEITYGMAFDDPNVHIVERWKLLNKNELEVQITINSNVALTKPYTYTMAYARRPSSELVGEVAYCDQPLVNDSLDLTPPSGGYIPPGATQ